jgi:hypothetical protein
MDWTANVSAPSSCPISSWNTNIGSLFLIQLVTPELECWDTSGNWWKDNEFGQAGLDTTCPYGWVRYENAGVSSYETNDSPGIALTGTQSAIMQDGFEDYLMYTPPPCGSNPVQCVPLGDYEWSANGSVDMPSSGGWADFTGSAGEIMAYGTAFTPNNIFPSWTQLNGTGIDQLVEQ